MRLHKMLMVGSGLVVCLTLVMATTAPAASSLSNSLQGFSGNSSEAGTLAALSAAGFEMGPNGSFEPGQDPADPVVFDSAGAHFGSGLPADSGRNYMRTIADYAFDSYVAEVTIVVDTLLSDQAFLGMGTGAITRWGSPDWAGKPTLFVSPQDGQLMTLGVQGISGDWENPSPPCPAGDWCGTASPGLVGANAGTHRLRMTLDATAKTWVGAVDIDYAGGAFVADTTSPTYPLANFYDDGGFVTIGWPTNPSRIYFGGDDGVVFKDFSVTVAGAGVPGDYNGDNKVDAADYVLWRDDPAAHGGTPAGYDTWRANFGNPPGTGSGLGAAGVPEPTSLVLMLGLVSCAALIRGTRS